MTQVFCFIKRPCMCSLQPSMTWKLQSLFSMTCAVKMPDPGLPAPLPNKQNMSFWQSVCCFLIVSGTRMSWKCKRTLRDYLCNRAAAAPIPTPWSQHFFNGTVFRMFVSSAKWSNLQFLCCTMFFTSAVGILHLHTCRPHCCHTLSMFCTAK